MENWGILFALAAALAWGSYLVPFKISKSENLGQFQAVMAVAIGLSGFLVALILKYPLSLNVYGLLSGLLWATANAISLIAVINLGISRAIPLLGSLVILGGFLWGTLVFRELAQGILMGFLGIILIVLGVILVSATENTQSPNVKKGLSASLVAGLIFGSQLVPLKLGAVAPEIFFFPSCLGIAVTGLIIALITKVKFDKKAIKLSFLSGAIWNIGNLLSLISISIIGLSKGGPISQSSIFVAVLWGLIYFREIRQKKARLQVLIGAVILVFGVITLGLA